MSSAPVFHDTSNVTVTDEVDEATRKVLELALKDACFPEALRLSGDLRRIKVIRKFLTHKVEARVLDSPVEVRAELKYSWMSRDERASGKVKGTCTIRLEGATSPYDTAVFEFERESSRMAVRHVPQAHHQN